MAESVLTLFRRNALRLGSKPCFHFKKENVWQKLSWVDAEEEVRRLSLGLAAIGLRPGETIGLLSQTRLEWTLLDLAILANQSVTVPIYPTLASDQIAYILKDSKASLLLVENRAQWERIESDLGGWSGAVIVIEGKIAGGLTLAELKEKGKSKPVNLYDENLRQIQPTQTATIVYTSGTTGPPKGAILTHRNLMAEIAGLQEVFHFGPDDIGLMCLPLAHVIARAMQFFQVAEGHGQAYAESLEKLAENFKEVKPHFVAVVPRLLEKSHQKILERVGQSSGLLQKIFFASVGLGLEIGGLVQKRLKPSFLGRFVYSLASLLLLRKVRQGFGGRIKVIVSGGAPLAKEVAQFFHAIGLLVIEGYGLTETFAAVTINRPDDFRFGTIGKPIEGVRVKIAGDGEICVKGDTIFAGYLGLKEATEKSFDSEGWFLTGDIGEFTKDGFLKITDRKKDMIATSAGKKVAPQNIENLLNQSPYIQQGMVYGDRQKFISALITLRWEAIETYALKEGIRFHARSDLAEDEQIHRLLESEIEKVNQRLSHFETIRKFAILPQDFSVETGELTPTLKVKRKAVTEKYKAILDQLYD